MNRISDNVLQEIQQRCDITEIISNYIPLKKAGRNFKALCPFHHEKTPSFMVNPDKQIYHCFGCGCGGDVISFVMKYERLEFPEAVRFLAEKAGISVSFSGGNPASESSLPANLYKINELAARYFCNNLLHERLGVLGRNYLAARRLDKDSLLKFRLGLALGGWDGLLNYLRQKGVSEALLLKSGVVFDSAQGKLYDRFRDRIILPIFNQQNKIIGFGGRIYRDDAEQVNKNGEKQPKYINSPETEIYSKGKNLYGFNFSKEFVNREDSVIIVEGYLDFIIPFQEGIKNIVASLGTAFTAEQVRLLKRYTRNAVIVFDPDTAGQNAALRSLELFLEEEMNVKITQLEFGYDPDTYVRNFGADGFRKKIDSAKSIFDYKLDLLFDKYDKNSPEERVEIASQMLDTIKIVRNEILKNTYLKRLSEQLNVSEESLRLELKKTAGSSGRRQERHVGPAGAGLRKITAAAEKMLVSLLFEDAELIKQAKKEIGYDDFSDPLVRKIAKHIFESEVSDLKPAVMLNEINDPEINSFVCNLIVQESGIRDKKKSFEDCLKKIKKDKIQNHLNRIQREIDITQKNNDVEKLRDLLKEYHGLKREKGLYEKK